VKKIILNLLAWLARGIAAKYRVKIVAVTGSVGKTTAKEAIFSVLQASFNAARSLRDANTAWGAVATIIDQSFYPKGRDSLGRAKLSIGELVYLAWCGLKKLTVQTKYPEVIVLELAADRPGDIRWFNRWFKYDVAVVTLIGSTHLDYYHDQAELTAEKLSIAAGLKAGGLVVINGECNYCQDFIDKSLQRKVTFGLSDRYDYWAKVDSQSVVLHHGEQSLPVRLVVGRQLVPAALMAMAVAQEFGLTDEQIRSGLEGIKALSGRFEIHQLARWVIIDDTHNAAPESMQVALTSLNDVARRRRVAILGEMRELGPEKEAQHHRLGEIAAKLTDLLIVMGEAGELIARGAQDAGMSTENIVKLSWDLEHPKVDATISQLLPILQDGDTVLVKASRALKLDRLVEKLLA
jgi:UDP-N-acetylmuramoyl-tripeptide--D-alanyl-D-alanine ligase